MPWGSGSACWATDCGRGVETKQHSCGVVDPSRRGRQDDRGRIGAGRGACSTGCAADFWGGHVPARRRYHPRMSRGAAAEQRVLARITSALPNPYRVYPNVSWTAPSRPGAPAMDGEADLVIAHPELGILVVEVKSGEPTRDASGRWWLGPHQLDRSPFEQAKANKYALAGKIREMSGWPHVQGPIAGATRSRSPMSTSLRRVGHDRPWARMRHRIILHATALESDGSARAWVEGAFGYWNGDGATRGHAPGVAGMEVIETLLASTVTLTRRLAATLREDRDELLQLSREQMRILNTCRGLRRVEVVGPAGSGKSMLAAERARRLAAEGHRTLLVCYNQRLANDLRRELDDAPQPAGMYVTTFHRLCERLGTQAGTLSARPKPVPQDWWDVTLPGALSAVLAARPDMRYHAIVVDEGQDFSASWLRTLDSMLETPAEAVLWVFHDPGQALFRDDIVADAGLGLTHLELYENHRNPEPMARLAARFYHGGLEPVAYRDGGLKPRIIEAAPGRDTREALRKELHRLVQDEAVKPFDIAVLSGLSTERSEVWRKRRFGDLELVNAALQDDGRRTSDPLERIPEDPGDMPLFDSIRRFKGLEAPVVVLVELPEISSAGEWPARLDELLYVALTRATSSLTVIASPELAARLR